MIEGKWESSGLGPCDEFLDSLCPWTHKAVQGFEAGEGPWGPGSSDVR